MTVLRLIGSLLFLASLTWGQCNKLVLNPITGMFDCTGGSGGGTGNGTADLIAVTGGGTATRTCAIPAGSLVATCYISSLDANVTTYNLTGLVNGQKITSKICRDGTATRTMAWPGTMLGFLDPIQIVNGCTIQSGTVIGGNLVADNSASFVDAGSTGVSNFSLCKAGSTIPTAAIPSGYMALGCDTSAFHAITSAGVDTTLGAGGGGGYAGTVTCGSGTTTTSTSPTALATITYGSGLTAGDMLRITTFWRHTGGTSNTPRMTITLGGTNVDSSGNLSWAVPADTSASFNAIIHVLSTSAQRVQGAYYRGGALGSGYWSITNDALAVNVSGSVTLAINGYFASGSGETLSLDHYCVERVK